MELCKVLLQINVVFFLIAFCLAQTESSMKPATHSSVKLKLLKPLEAVENTTGQISEQKENGIKTTSLNFYTPLSIFPSDETKYSTNETLIQQLLKLNEHSSEVDNLLSYSNLQFPEPQENSKQFNVQNTATNNIRVEGANDESRNVQHANKINDVKSISGDENNYDSDFDENIDDAEISKSEAEWIENGENTEDDRANVSVEVINETVHSTTVHYTIKSDYFGIFAGFFIIIGVIVYLTMSAWRRMMKQRYKHREMLVNDEEFYDPSDMKHFSI